MEEGKRDPFADFMNALCSHDTVILRLTGIGETLYTTQEVHEMISFRLANHKRRADAAVRDLKYLGDCSTCRHNQYPCEMEDAGHECWQWRGPQEGEGNAETDNPD